MKPLLLTLIGFLSLAGIGWGQASMPASLSLSNWGNFSTTYTLSGSPTTVGDSTIYSYQDTSGPQSPFGFGAQRSLSIAVGPDGTKRLNELTDWLAPWIINARVLFNDNGSIRSTSGYATNIDSSNFSVSWDGGGFGPGYSISGGGEVESGPVISPGEVLSRGLSFQNGTWIPTRQ